MTEHTRNQIFLERYPKKILSQKVHLGPVRWLPKRFSKFQFLLVKICILISDFWVIFENYSMRMLSISGNYFIAHWAYKKTISLYIEHTRNEFRACSASGKKWTVFTCKLMWSIRGRNFIAHWAYAEQISLLAEHMHNGFHRWLSIRKNV